MFCLWARSEIVLHPPEPPLSGGRDPRRSGELGPSPPSSEPGAEGPPAYQVPAGGSAGAGPAHQHPISVLRHQGDEIFVVLLQEKEEAREQLLMAEHGPAALPSTLLCGFVFFP